MKAFTKPVSASMMHSWQNCPRSFYYHYILHLRQEVTAANLPFGHCIHTASTGYIVAKFKGIPFDRAQVFRDAWDEANKKEIIEFSSIWDKDALGATGEFLLDLFADQWDQLNLIPLIDAKGEPLVEQSLRAVLPNGIELYGIQDFAGMDIDTNVVVVDIKSASSEAAEGFVSVSDQLTHYQILNEANKDSLGIEQVDKIAFFEMIKRKVPKTNGKGKGPKIAGIEWVNRRSDRELVEFFDKIEWMMDDINRGRFPKTPRMAWNTPCGMCNFKELCHNNDMSGLVVQRKAPFRSKAA